MLSEIQYQEYERLGNNFLSTRCRGFPVSSRAVLSGLSVRVELQVSRGKHASLWVRGGKCVSTCEWNCRLGGECASLCECVSECVSGWVNGREGGTVDDGGQCAWLC